MSPADRTERFGAMLRAAGYVYNKDITCWVHKAKGRAISLETVHAHDEAWVMGWIESGGRSTN